MSYVPYRRSATTGLKSWLPPVLVSALLWWAGGNAISAREAVMATLLLFLPWNAYQRWQRDGSTQVPLFALIALAYWAAFAMPLWLGNPAVEPDSGRPFAEPTVFAVMAMAVAGVLAMGAGMKLPFRPFNPAAMPDVSDTPGSWLYLYIVMAIGTLLSISEGWNLILGSAGHQLINTLTSTVPMAICAMLTIRQFDRTATLVNRYVLAAFLVIRTVIGIAGGVLSPVIFMGVILALIHLSRRRRLPLRAILVIVPLALFLQTGKSVFREVYWTQGRQGGVIEKAQFWLKASLDQWNSALRNSNSQESQELASSALDRVALLSQSANVIAKTPLVVPFQYGESYAFLAATLVPRAVWPNKPTVNDANRFYQVAYGLTAKEDLEGVSISVGCLTEAFMNFGWWGVGFVMFFIGFLVGLFERTLLDARSGLLFCGVGLALLNGLLTVESQASQYLGGLLQQIAIVFVFALPVVRRRKMRGYEAGRLAETA